MKIFARVLMFAGLLCFVPFMFPSYQTDTTDNGTEERFTFGLPQSPWFVHTTTDTKIEVNNKGVTSFSTNSAWSNKVEFISWSSLFLIAGIALLMVSRRLLKGAKA